jgi:hypothetical protein
MRSGPWSVEEAAVRAAESIRVLWERAHTTHSKERALSEFSPVFKCCYIFHRLLAWIKLLF